MVRRLLVNYNDYVIYIIVAVDTKILIKIKAIPKQLSIKQQLIHREENLITLDLANQQSKFFLPKMPNLFI